MRISTSPISINQINTLALFIPNTTFKQRTQIINQALSHFCYFNDCIVGVIICERLNQKRNCLQIKEIKVLDAYDGLECVEVMVSHVKECATKDGIEFVMHKLSLELKGFERRVLDGDESFIFSVEKGESVLEGELLLDIIVDKKLKNKIEAE